MKEFKNKIICGNNVEVLTKFPEDCIDLVVTSPPYDGLRDYNGYNFDFDGLLKQLKRVIKPGGVVVWVIGDATENGSESGTSFRQALGFIDLNFKLHDTMIYEKNGATFPATPDSNRYSQVFEYMFIFSNETKPKTSNLIIDKPNRWAGETSFGQTRMRQKDGKLIKYEKKPVPEFSARNNIWKYNTGFGYSTKDKSAHLHPAIFPEKLAEDHILTWSNKDDIVLDPFCGSGTTCKMAKMNNRNFIGIDLSEKYCKLSEHRVKMANNSLKSFM